MEDIKSWQGFLAAPKDRGVLGKSLKLIITDGNPGLLKPLKAIYPFVKGQGGLAHKMGNMAVKIRKMNRAHGL